MSKRRKQPVPQPVPQGEAAEPTASGGAVEWPSPIRDGEWVDAAGTRWRLRGVRRRTPAKRVEHLLRSPEVRVLLFHGPGAPTEVAPGDRDALCLRMRPHLREPEVRAPGDFTGFQAGEFRDDERRSLLVVEESC
ncbi:hypothetical protein [Saccharothrix coeruleofusca]|uniref:Uncharacterized protein n=1 Tax=Saccharothrix coeruleofusca TaxID=33919 RepID=A0A918AHH8_9PSEU|nr:hypothetical protein [Saccharothrix coeruleofusca]MBP2340105.1 hypothetical protein [Saccharothrix coeruleofusca]GGP37292.1 hypothetical protein GCM10010185_05810 [Saccharothrix coeruleofusca]